MQVESRPAGKLEQSWAENELEELNSASQGREPTGTKTFKPGADPNGSLSLGKTAMSYPHMSMNPKELSNEQLEEVLRTGKFSSTRPQPAELPSDKVAYSSGPNTSLLGRSTGPALPETNKSLSFHPAPTKSAASLLAKYATPNKSTVTGLATNPQLQYSASKAYTSAMKALQDKVRQLERENELLAAKAKTTEKTLEEGQGKMQARMVEELTRCAEAEKNLQKDFLTAQQEIKQLRQELAEAAGTRDFMQRQLQQLEKEKERHLEQNSIEREQWRKERTQLVRQIAELTEQVQAMARQKEAMMIEVEETKSKLSEIESLLDRSKRETSSETKRLKTENEDLKSKLRNIKRQCDADLLATKSDLQTAMAEVDRYKAKLKEEAIREKNTTASLKRTIENQKKEIELLKSRQGRTNVSRTATATRADTSTAKPSLAATMESKELRTQKKKENPARTVAGTRSGSKREAATSRAEETDRDRGRKQSAERRTSRSRSGSKGRSSRRGSVDKSRMPAETRKRDKSVNKSRDMMESASSIHGTNLQDEDSKVGKAAHSKTASNLEIPSMLNQADTVSQISEYPASTKTKGQLEDVSNEIFYLEREIADLNRQYKDLLTKSQEANNATVLTNIRIDLNNIARLLEEKSEKLFELKKQQQLALKSYQSGSGCPQQSLVLIQFTSSHGRILSVTAIRGTRIDIRISATEQHG